MLMSIERFSKDEVKKELDFMQEMMRPCKQ